MDIRNYQPTINEINGFIIDDTDNTWSNVEKSKLIESLIMKLPINNIWVFASNDGLRVIDGQKRIAAIKEFFNGEFALSGLFFMRDLEGKTVKDIPRNIIRKIEETIVNVTVIDPSVNKEIVVEIADRLGNSARVSSWF